MFPKKKYFNPHPKICLLILERKEGRQRGKHRCKRETLISYLSYAPWLGIKPTTFGCMGWCSNQANHWQGLPKKILTTERQKGADKFSVLPLDPPPEVSKAQWHLSYDLFGDVSCVQTTDVIVLLWSYSLLTNVLPYVCFPVSLLHFPFSDSGCPRIATTCLHVNFAPNSVF